MSARRQKSPCDLLLELCQALINDFIVVIEPLVDLLDSFPDSSETIAHLLTKVFDVLTQAPYVFMEIVQFRAYSAHFCTHLAHFPPETQFSLRESRVNKLLQVVELLIIHADSIASRLAMALCMCPQRAGKRLILCARTIVRRPPLCQECIKVRLLDPIGAPDAIRRKLFSPHPVPDCLNIELQQRSDLRQREPLVHTTFFHILWPHYTPATVKRSIPV